MGRGCVHIDVFWVDLDWRGGRYLGGRLARCWPMLAECWSYVAISQRMLAGRYHVLLCSCDVGRSWALLAMVAVCWPNVGLS